MPLLPFLKRRRKEYRREWRVEFFKKISTVSRGTFIEVWLLLYRFPKLWKRWNSSSALYASITDCNTFHFLFRVRGVSGYLAGSEKSRRIHGASGNKSLKVEACTKRQYGVTTGTWWEKERSGRNRSVADTRARETRAPRLRNANRARKQRAPPSIARWKMAVIAGEEREGWICLQ